MRVTTESGEQLLQQARNALREHEYTYTLADAKLYLAGSVAVNGAGNDVDVVLASDDLSDIATRLEEAEWEMVTSEVYRGISCDGWFSARKGDINLLVSESDQVELWNASTRVCQVFRELVGRDTTRDERVALHRAVWND